MKKLLIGLIMASVLAIIPNANSQEKSGAGDRDRDQFQTLEPARDQVRTRAGESLPNEVKQGIEQMRQAQQKHEQQLRDKKAALTICTDTERQKLREQLREAIKEQASDRKQLRERLKEMREQVPTHEEVIDQARERTRDRDGK